MSKYLGDFAVDSTVRVYFSTNAADGGRESPSDTFEVADFEIYRNGVATARASQAGWTYDNEVNGRTGIHCLSIDLSDDTDAGFYAAGGEYAVVLYPDETVDGQSIAAILAQFSIERIDRGRFASPVVYVDSGGTNSTAWPYGTAAYPTTTIANGKVIADANSLDTIHVKGSQTLAAAMEGYLFVGGGFIDAAEIIDLDGQSVEHSTFRLLTITGATGNAALVGDRTTFLDCYLYAVTNIQGQAIGGRVEGACSIRDAGYASFIDCLFGASVACTLTIQAPTACDLVNMRGTLTLAGMDGGVCSVAMQNGAVLTIDNTCTAGTITVSGDGTLVDNSGAGCTVNRIYPRAQDQDGHPLASRNSRLPQ